MKNIKTLIIVIVVAGLAFLAFQLANKPVTSKMSTEAISNFEVKDTATISKLALTDTEGNIGVTLVRNGKSWETENGECVQQHLVHTILETIKYIKVKSPVAKGTIETINKNIAAHHVKMEIYINEKLSKTWYIGDPTQDQYGTFMLLKDAEKGKSPEPFIMHLPNMYGNLSSRFITDPRGFACTKIFSYDPLSIASVEVTTPDTSENNFKIVANDKNSFSVFNNENSVTRFDTTLVRDYLVGFRKIHFENHNYVLSPEEVDSMLQTPPYYTINVTSKEGVTEGVELYRRKYDYEKYGLDGELLVWDQDRLWVVMEDGTLVVGQYFVFGKLLRDVRYFKREAI